MIQKFLFFLLIFLIFLLPARDPDFGWQLRCGQELLNSGKLCTHNLFSVVLPGYTWAYPILVYPVFLATTFTAFGFWGISILNAFLITLSYLLLFSSIKNKSLQKMSLILISIPLSWSVFSLGLRAQEFSLFFFSLTLFILLRFRLTQTKLILLLPFIFFLWANTHGGLIYGFFLLLFFLVEQLLLKNWQKSLSITTLLTFSFFATLINPFGINLYKEILLHTQVPLDALIAEWVPPSPLYSLALVFVFLFLISSILFSLVTNRKKPSLFLLLASILFFLLALKARRNLPFSFFVIILLLLETKVFPSSRTKVVSSLFTVFLVFAILFMGFTRLSSTNKTNTDWSLFCQSAPVPYPCNAVSFLQKQPTKGAIFNTYEWGGFLIWQLPEFKVFVDGRMPAWPHPSGKSPYTLYLEIIQAQKGWEQVLIDYGVDWILIQNQTFLDLELQKKPKPWVKEAYRDSEAVIYQVSAVIQ